MLITELPNVCFINWEENTELKGWIHLPMCKQMTNMQAWNP